MTVQEKLDIFDKRVEPLIDRMLAGYAPSLDTILYEYTEGLNMKITTFGRLLAEREMLVKDLEESSDE